MSGAMTTSASSELDANEPSTNSLRSAALELEYCRSAVEKTTLSLCAKMALKTTFTLLAATNTES